MNSQRSLRSSCVLLTLFAVLAASACNKEDDKAVKGRAGPNGAGHDSVSDVALNEDGLGPIQVGMTLAEAVNMGLLNENPNMKKECDFVFPAVGAGVPDNVGVMIVRGKSRAHRCRHGISHDRGRRENRGHRREDQEHIRRRRADRAAQVCPGCPLHDRDGRQRQRGQGDRVRDQREDSDEFPRGTPT